MSEVDTTSSPPARHPLHLVLLPAQPPTTRPPVAHHTRRSCSHPHACLHRATHACSCVSPIDFVALVTSGWHYRNLCGSEMEVKMPPRSRVVAGTRAAETS